MAQPQEGLRDLRIILSMQASLVVGAGKRLQHLIYHIAFDKVVLLT